MRIEVPDKFDSDGLLVRPAHIDRLATDVRKACPGSFTVQDRYDRDVRCPCGKCDRCQRFNAATMTGRLVAEAVEAASTWFVTLTYSQRFYGDKFNYKDIQDMMKRLRHSHAGVRFFVVGELGGMTKRRHWHMLLFFPTLTPVPRLWRGVPSRNGKPAVPGELWEHWPWGYSTIKRVKSESPTDLVKQVRYVANYLHDLNRSDADAYATIRARWSCKPILGGAYLKRQAHLYAAHPGKALPLTYSFAGMRPSPDKPLWKYAIVRALRGFYFREYIAECLRLRPDEPVKGGELFEEALRSWHLEGGSARQDEIQARKLLLIEAKCRKSAPLFERPDFEAAWREFWGGDDPPPYGPEDFE
ncbi:MAG: replication initiator protein [Microvirus sp.]|nr:MAG: replication initiator protein [Microvirus sp.]